MICKAKILSQHQVNVSIYSMYPLGSGSSVTSYVIAPNSSYTFINYNGGNWYMTSTNDLDNGTGIVKVTNGGTGTSTAPAIGSIPLATSTSVYSPLAIGTNGQLLTSNGTTATWATASFAPTASPTFTGTVTLPASTALTTAVLTSPFETVSTSATALSGSTAAALNASTSSFFNYTANPTAAFTVNMTNCPTTTGQSVTFAMLVNNGATAYLPLNFTVNGNQAGASSSALPAQGATNNGITTWYQGATAWTAADASTLDSYTFVVICTGSSTWTVLAALTKF